MSRLEDEKHPLSIRAVERALNILSCFRMNRPEMSLGDLAKEAGLSKSTAFRLLVTMEGLGFITQDRTSMKYSLGPRLFYLGSIIKNTLSLRKAAKEVMEDLGKRCRETVSLNVEEDGQRVVVDSVESQGVIRNYVHVGLRHPLHIGAAGKVILAFKEKPELDKYLADLQDEETSIILERKLAEIRALGYIISQDEGAMGTVCVAAPIFDRFGIMVASLCVSGTTLSLGDRYQTLVVREVMDSARQISWRLGWPGPEQRV